MNQETTRTEDKALDRRSALRALFGLAAVAVGATAIMVPGAAQAAPLTPTPTPPAAKEQDLARNEDLARDEDLPKAEPTRHYYRRRVYRRRYYRPIYRRRVYYRRRRYIRRVYY